MNIINNNNLINKINFDNYSEDNINTEINIDRAQAVTSATETTLYLQTNNS